MTKFRTLKEAADNNTAIILKMFGDDTKYEILIPSDEFSCFDGIIKFKDSGKYAFVEVKERQFSNKHLKNNFGGSFILEKHKYNCLHKSIEGFDKEVASLLYICVTDNGYAYCFNLLNKEYDWISKELVCSTYNNTDCRIKEITYLHIGDSSFFTNINCL